MTPQEAANILKKQFPEKIPIGYWVKENGYVLNTRSLIPDGIAPGQFLITEDGKVYGTNPVRSRLRIEDMKKF